MEPVADEYICFIESTADPETGKAACLMRWGRITTLLPPDEVLTTARDLMAAATAAETDIAMIVAFRKELGLDPNTIGHMVLDVRRNRPAPTDKAALRISAVAGAKTCRPYVHISRGSNKGELTPDEARQMAMNWTQAAIAAQIDVRLRYALGQWDHLTATQIKELFALMQKVQR